LHLYGVDKTHMRNDRQADPAFFIGPIGPIPVRDDDDPAAVAGALAARSVGSMLVADELLEAIADPDPQIRFRAVERLAARHPDDARTVPALIAALSDSAWEVRDSAAQALWNLRDPSAREALANALDDSVDDVGWTAATALRELGDQRAVGFFMRDLQHDEPGRRVWAAESLGQLGAQDARPMLQRLAEDDEDENVRQAAQAALAQLR
jgi:HEAT repeat protein